MNSRTPVIVAGSGPSGVMAAQQLLDYGLSVLMLDVGFHDRSLEQGIPDKAFHELRNSDKNQARYFLGPHLEGVPTGKMAVGAQLTPPRQYIANPRGLAPYESAHFEPMLSLARGGLGAAWGAAVFTYTASELRCMGITSTDLSSDYCAVAREIGVSGSVQSDIHSFCVDPLTELQPSLPMDSNTESIFRSYTAKREEIRSRGMYLGPSTLAVLSRDQDDRKRNPLYDMDFWTDRSRSVYRPIYTLEKFQQHPNFQYRSGILVKSFRDDETSVTVHGVDVTNQQPLSFQASKVLLCAGALNSVRIAMASHPSPSGIRQPLLCNPYTYITALNSHMFGKSASDGRHSLSQLFGIYQEHESNDDLTALQFYSYRSLLMFKILKEIPLPLPVSLPLLRLCINSLVIVGLHHADSPSSEKWVALEPQDRLRFSYSSTNERLSANKKREQNIVKTLRKLGCHKFAQLSPGHASSIHYAGTLPIGSDSNTLLTCDAQFRLHGTRHVYIGDSSSWKHLPAKGLTFTLMANSRRVAREVAQNLLGAHA